MTTTKSKRINVELDANTQNALSELQAVVGDLTGDRTYSAAIRYAVLQSARTLRASR